MNGNSWPKDYSKPTLATRQGTKSPAAEAPASQPSACLPSVSHRTFVLLVIFTSPFLLYLYVKSHIFDVFFQATINPVSFFYLAAIPCVLCKECRHVEYAYCNVRQELPVMCSSQGQWVMLPCHHAVSTPPVWERVEWNFAFLKYFYSFQFGVFSSGILWIPLGTNKGRLTHDKSAPVLRKSSLHLPRTWNFRI